MPKKGYKQSDEHKQKLSSANKNMVFSQSHRKKLCENHVGMSGKNHTEEAMRKNSEAHKNIPCSEETRQKISQSMSGERHYNWQGGKSFEEYPREFFQIRDGIRERDAYICQECFIQENGREHSVHHIDYDKENNEPNNLILLCGTCHTKTNFSREYWHIRLTNKLNERGIN